MIILSNALSPAHVRTYYTEEFRNARENYYTAGDLIPGRWDGQLAQSWGLSGEVHEEHIQRLADGLHPTTGERLVRQGTMRWYINERGKPAMAMAHRAGWDATVSAPKSVSLTALVGGDDRVREAHRASVDVALDEVERYVQAHSRGHHPVETTGKWIAAIFEHDSARPVEGYAAPHVHTHVVFFNVTERQNGQICSLEAREVYKTQSYGTAVYRSALATRLATLGYATERGRSGQPEIGGYTTAYLEASSPRCQQIHAQLAKEHQSSVVAAQLAQLRTREAKIFCSHDEMQRRHRELAEAFGSQPARVVQAAKARSLGIESQGSGLTAHAAVTLAKEQGLERAAVVDKRALLGDALRRSMGDATVGAIVAEVERRVAVGEFVGVTQPPGALAHAFTTREMIDLEQDTIKMMRAGQQTLPAFASEVTRGAVDFAQTHLSEHQRAAVHHVLASQDQVLALEGVAGAGRITALAAIRHGAAREGYRVEGLASSSRVARELADAGMTSNTLERHLTGRDEPRDQHPYLYVLDASSLASTTQMNQFFHRLMPQDRVLLVGNVCRHPAEAGRPGRQIRDAGVETVRLDDIVRQQDPALRQVVKSLSRGVVSGAIQQLEQQGRVHAITARDDRLTAIAAAYARYPEGTLVVALDHQSRREMNEIIHGFMQTTGQVDDHEHRVRVLVARQEITTANRQRAQHYEPGDVVRYTVGSQVLAINAGEYARVRLVDAHDNHLTVARENGDRVTYNPRQLRGVTLYREAERALAPGDRVQFTEPYRERHVANRDLGTIRQVDPNGHLHVRLDSGRTVAIAVAAHPHLDYGYAVTSDGNRGQTADRVIVHLDTDRLGAELVSRRVAYAALSRGRYDAQIYTNDKAQLEKAIGRDVSRRSGVEFGDAPESATSQRGLSVVRRPEVQLSVAR